jgi:Uma2 family endonuclease
MTFADFERTPEPRAGRQELYHGELREVSPPKHDHYLVQRQIRRLLEAAAGTAGEVDIELGYRPLPEYEYWEADIAFVSRERWDGIPRKGNLQGSPELVIEVLSPSNSASEIWDRRNTCFASYCREFWVVDLDQREVEVATPDGRSATYRPGQEIPLFFAADAKIAVSAIFGL